MCSPLKPEDPEETKKMCSQRLHVCEIPSGPQGLEHTPVLVDKCQGRQPRETSDWRGEERLLPLAL